MGRLTHKRSNGIKEGYWSPNKKEELVKRLAEYENTGLSPEEVEDLRRQQDRWILVEEQLPEDGTYLCTLVGELVGQEDPFTGMCGIENGIWDEPDCVIAWQLLPESYKGGQNETRFISQCQRCAGSGGC